MNIKLLTFVVLIKLLLKLSQNILKKKSFYSLCKMNGIKCKLNKMRNIKL